ncbi:hypothetical protein [Ruegeria profundi]|nr:hypothetical protein [Ruegeria profundi]
MRTEVAMVVVTLAIGLFFATCIVLVEPLFLLGMLRPMLGIPFFVGFFFAWWFHKLGYFGGWASRGALVFGLVALPCAIALPILIEVIGAHLEKEKVELPISATVYSESPDGRELRFESAESVEALMLHFEDELGIERWLEVSFVEWSKSRTAERYDGYVGTADQELKVRLFHCEQLVCGIVVWPKHEANLVYFTAAFGLIVLCILGVFPPLRDLLR